jgi:hypothetical protein
MNARCFVNQVAVPKRAGVGYPQHKFDFHLTPSSQPNRQAEDEAKAVGDLIRVYIWMGLPRAAAIEAAWRDCASCFTNLFPCLNR